MHPTAFDASAAAVGDGRITAEQQATFDAFMQNPEAFPIGEIISTILPIVSLIFPQFAAILPLIQALIQELVKPVPGPTPSNPLQQLIDWLKSLANGGKTPVPLPMPLPSA